MVKTTKISKKTNSKKYILICPKCGSKNIVSNQLNTDTSHLNKGLSLGYFCKDCSYSAALFPELTEEGYKEFLKKLSKSKNKINNDLEHYAQINNKKNKWFWILLLIFWGLFLLTAIILTAYSLFTNVIFLSIGLPIVIVTIIVLYKINVNSKKVK